MMIVFRLLEISSPVPAASDKFLHDGVPCGKRSFVLRPVNSAGRRDRAVWIDDRILHGVDVHRAAKRMQRKLVGSFDDPEVKAGGVVVGH